MTMKSSEHIKRSIPDHAFRSIGLPDAELMLVKSELHSAIKAAILKNAWSQRHTGEQLGWGQPDVSKIMNDRFSQHSVERLIKAALDLGLTVSFGVGAARSKREAGRIGLVELARSAAATRKTGAVRATRRPAKPGRSRAASAATHAAAE
jgi:predicted XRE-type DNA-binding protein